MRGLIALNMIVRNEAVSINAVLESVLGAVDSIVIMDTGSTDSTVEIASDFCRKHGFPFQIKETPFISFDGITDRNVIDYAKTRNAALQLELAHENPAVFTLSLSGDETLHNGTALRKFLEEHRDDTDGAYRVMMRKGTSRWQYPRVLRVDSKWRYRFPIHEIPFSPEGETEAKLIEGPEIVYAPTDQSRFFQRMKNVDLPVLSILADAKGDSHDDQLSRARALVQLAQTHENLALEHEADVGSPWLSHQMAAMAFYWRRADLEGDPDEMHYALFKFYDIAGKVHILYSHEEFIPRLVTLAEMDPRRPEVRYLLAMHASQADVRKGAFYAMEAVKVAQEAKANPLPYPTDDRIEWLALQIAAECAKKLEKVDRAKLLAEQAIACGGPKEVFAEYIGA